MLNFPISEEEAKVLLILLGKLPIETGASSIYERLKKVIEDSKGKQ